MGKPRLTTDWDALVTSAPVNAQAAKDASAVGGAFEPRKKLVDEFHLRSHAPFKTKPVQYGVDLTGLECGRLTVVGLADIPKTSKNQHHSKWVVRCACGYYETRRARALQNPLYAKDARCSECAYVAHLNAGRGGVAFPKQTVRA